VTPAYLAELKRIVPEFDYVPSTKHHLHPQLHTERKVLEALALFKMGIYSTSKVVQRIIDVGGNPVRHHNEQLMDGSPRDSVVHSCCPGPELSGDPKDILRQARMIEKYGVPTPFNSCGYLGSTCVNTCSSVKGTNHKFTHALFVHSV
jgi:hypothetical protein